LGKSFLEKMEISECFFGKKHRKLAYLRNLAPKIIYELPTIVTLVGNPHVLGMEEVQPMGGVPSKLKGSNSKGMVKIRALSH
jgi:hypothetical protein